MFIPLGGTKEIGLNLNLYQYKGKWIIFDMGIGFTSEIPGIDVMVPDIEFLQQIKDDVLGLIITHAHEDHLGAVQYLWEEVQVPVYSSEFTALFLREKLKEYDLHTRVKINIKEQDKPFDLGPFKIEFFEINHSVPEMNAAIISTEEDNIVHTGDWKFDKNPVIGKPDDFKKLKKIGERGITALICDSTNVFSEGHSGSEGELQKSIIDLVKKQNNMVIISTFASNLGRLVSIIEAARATKRKIVVCGRSMDRMIKIGAKLGYIDNLDDFISREQIKKHPRNKLIIMATGCQGEERAAMKRISDGTYPFIKLQKNDAVIFSSKIIPGNEIKIGHVLNKLAEKQVHILTERDHFVHVSGHPNREELREMYDMIKPKIAIPVHGELMHINEHASFTEDMGIPQTVRVTNGSCVVFEGKKAKIIGEVPNGYMGVDGNSLIDIDGSVIKARRILAENGVVIVQVKLLAKEKKLKAKPVIRAPGLFDDRNDKDIIEYLEDMLNKKLAPQAKTFFAKGKLNEKAVVNDTRSDLRKILKQSINKEPIVEVLIDVS